MIELERALFVVLFVGILVAISLVARRERRDLTPTPTEPPTAICTIKAVYPAADGGYVLTVHCPICEDRLNEAREVLQEQGGP